MLIALPTSATTGYCVMMCEISTALSLSMYTPKWQCPLMSLTGPLNSFWISTHLSKIAISFVGRGSSAPLKTKWTCNARAGR